MDIEQDTGDSVSTTVSKDNNDVASNGLDGQISLEKTHNQEFGLEAQGATTDEANEESEMSAVSGAGAPVGNKKKKRKNKRRRNKNRNRENFASDHENSHASKVASNETLVGGTSDDKPVVITTHVCSSSELDKVRKLIDENGNPMTSSLSMSQPISIHDDDKSPDSATAAVMEESTGESKSVEEIVSRGSSEEIATTKIETNSNPVDDNKEAEAGIGHVDPQDDIKEGPEISATLSPVAETPTEENVQSKSSINVIFKVGAAVFENQSFTGPPPQSVDNPTRVDTTSNMNPPENEEQKEENKCPPLTPASVSESEAPIETYEQPTQPSLGELWMMADTQSEADNNNKIESQEETRENELVNTDDLILNDNNYFQEPEPKIEMISQDLQEMLQADIDKVLQAAVDETFGREEEEASSRRCVTDDDEQSSTQIELPVTVETTSESNSRPTAPPKEFTAESGQNDDDGLAELSKSAVKIVLSSDKSVVANLSASSSVSSRESTGTFKLPKVPNPSVENHEGLQHLVVPPLQINASSLARLMLVKNSGEKMDAAVESQQQLELPAKTEQGSTETIPLKVETSHSSSSDIVKNKYLVDMSPTVDAEDLTQSGTESFSDETVSEKTLTLDSDKGDDNDDYDDDMTANKTFVDDQKFSSSSIIAENIENWVIDPSVIEDALTESEIGEQLETRSRSSIMKNFLNCFGKRKKSSTTTAETMETTETSTERERPTERPRSRFKSFARSLPRRK